MGEIDVLKELPVTETPLILFDCELPNGIVERWCTHRVTVDGQGYEGRVIRHNLAAAAGGSEDGIDAVASLTLALANADSRLSQVERTTGFKGARVTARFCFFDLRQRTKASETTVLFRGIAEPPQDITEDEFRLAVRNSFSLQRTMLPDIRIQRRCPWHFPPSEPQRREAANQSGQNRYSHFGRCGYSPDQTGGTGNLDSAGPYATCDRTRRDCVARGMFSTDEHGRTTARFGGIEFVPSSIVVRSYGERGTHVSRVVENEARYNDFVPLVYGTAWYKPPVVFARNDGNLTRMEVLLGAGEIQGVLKVLVNGIDIPLGAQGRDMTATGWHRVVSYGAREGAFNTDFSDASGRPLGDPYGSMAYMSVVVPNRISDGRSMPEIEVLAEGLRLPRFDTTGAYLGDSFTNNPAWVLLDVLRRSGWRMEDVDARSFALAAAYCGELIAAEDLHGNPVEIARFQCNLALTKRRSTAELIRGIRAGSRLYLTYSAEGKLELQVEAALAVQQPAKPAGSNSTEPLNGGWPAYEFGDGSSSFTGIVRRSGSGPSIRFWSRAAAETPNRFSLEYQDAFNEYQQDSVSLTDTDDVLLAGQEISATVPALGAANFNQAARAVRFHLAKAVSGNRFVEFETSVRGVRLRPGDLITIAYLKEGLQRQAFRIVRMQPGQNFRTAAITAQIHRDEWHTDSIAETPEGTGGQRSRELGVPRPLEGSGVDEDGRSQFGIVEKSTEDTEGASRVTLATRFTVPRPAGISAASIPSVSLAAEVDDAGGALAGNRSLYYAITATDGSGIETDLSFVVRATLSSGTNTNRVTLGGLSFGAGTSSFNVYRGEWPGRLRRIAAAQPPDPTFTDAGMEEELVPPPDRNFDHANFYWRMELHPETQVTLHSETSVGNGALHMVEDGWRGAIVRITRGRGAGQERPVVSNTATTVFIQGTWAVIPDETSWFTFCEAAWHFAAEGKASPLEFEVPNRAGATVQVTGRAANIHNREAAAEVSPVTRWRIAGAGRPTDEAAPPAPVFGLNTRGRGQIELGGIGFADIGQTRTATSARLTVHFWNELNSPSASELISSLGAGDGEVQIGGGPALTSGTLVQIDTEVLRITEVSGGSGLYRVERACLGSAAFGHNAGSRVYTLDRKVFVTAFPRDFFGSPAAGNFCFPAALPDARVAAAELCVFNAKGSSPPSVACYTATADGGLRTGSGGQYSVQVEGVLGLRTAAAPPIIVQESHAVRDAIAVVQEAPIGGAIEIRIRQDDEVFATLVIPDGANSSAAVSGFGLAPLRADSQVRVDITSVPQGTATSPGAGLTVRIRF